MVLIKKSCPFSLIRQYEVTPNCLSVKMTSASNQELEIAFVYNPNDEMDKIRNLKAAVTHLADNGCTNQLIIANKMVTKIPTMRPEIFSLDYKRMMFSLMSTDSYTPIT